MQMGSSVSRNLGVSLALFVWRRSQKASCLHGKTSEVSTPLLPTLHQPDVTACPVTLHFTPFFTHIRAQRLVKFSVLSNFTILVDSPLQPLGILEREWRVCFNQTGFVWGRQRFACLQVSGPSFLGTRVPVQTRSLGVLRCQFSPGMFCWKHSSIFYIKQQPFGWKPACFAHWWTDESPVCVLQLLPNPPTPSQLIQMFRKASYC